MKGIVKSHAVRFTDDRRSLLLDGRLESGEVRAGMLLRIAFNPSFGMTVPIAEVFQAPDGRVLIRLDCENEEEAEFVEAMKFGVEWLEVLAER